MKMYCTNGRKRRKEEKQWNVLYRENKRDFYLLLTKGYKLSKWVSHIRLEANEHHQRVTGCFSLLSRYRSVHIFERVLTGDEKWFLYDTHKRARRWLSPLYPVSHTKRLTSRPGRIMPCIWWAGTALWAASSGPNHRCEPLRVPFAALINRKGVPFLHDNARYHVTWVTTDTVRGSLCHPSYSADLAPTNFHL